MLPRLCTFLCFLQLAHATSTNTTTTACPSADLTTSNYRSVWSLLASCGLTLLICVWHAIHPSVPLPHFDWLQRVLYRLSLVLIAFFTPEIMIATAFSEWRNAKKVMKDVQSHGYTWWTMTHSYFIINGGFVLCDDMGFKEIGIDEFLSLIDAGHIVNPVITQYEIKDKSKSDGLGKAILIMQLSWFITQIIARLLNHLTVTLVELDTVCMALFTVPLIIFWWSKPCCPDRPHIFYKHNSGSDADIRKMLKERSRPQTLGDSTIDTDRVKSSLVIPADLNSDKLVVFSLLLTWSIFGTLHAIAWHYEFPTEIEKDLWRVSSLVLAGSPVIFAVVVTISVVEFNRAVLPDVVFCSLVFLDFLLLVVGVISRVLLVALMLVSLRSLPSSAHVIIRWTTYIPHL